jgi:Leucine-rich repeat (LRR) protein
MFFNSPDFHKKNLLKWAKNHKIDFPSTPEELEKLQILDIRLKKISKLPKEINCLTGLVEINLEFNELNELPWEFAHLKKLKIINLGHNKFVDLPGVICHLPGVEVLNMESNSVKKITPVIGQLESLIELNFSFNHLNELPEEIGHLKHLVRLNLAANNISQLPLTMRKLYNLVEFKLWNNKIIELPDFIKELPNLKVIELVADSGKINQQLIAASINDDTLKAEMLINMGADVNYKWMNFGNLPFTTSLFEAHSIEMIQLLIKNGANPNIKRELPKPTTIKVWESEKSSIGFETFLSKKHPVEIAKFLKTLNLQSS